jgi:hypothetical protein
LLSWLPSSLVDVVSLSGQWSRRSWILHFKDPRYRIFLGDEHFVRSIFGWFACHPSTIASGAEGWVLSVHVYCSGRLKLGY